MLLHIIFFCALWLIVVGVILFRQIMYCLADNWNLGEFGEFADTQDVYIGW